MNQRTVPPPLALYVHIPWCVRKCPYCDFNSHPLRASPAEFSRQQDRYIDALLYDLEDQLPQVWGRPVNSIFIGGGTPSLLSAGALERLLSGLRARLPLRPALEITLEANPGSVERGKFAEFRAAGVNRLSLGVQSLHDEQLRRLGRIHDRRAALAAITAAQNAGFEQLNVDLMYALPGQNVAQALADLRQVLALQPSHISHYQLTLEPNTLFYKYPPPLPDDDSSWRMQRDCQQLLAEAGYPQYEISAYARSPDRCQHNLNYWRFGDYLGIGAGAHGKLTRSDADRWRVERLSKRKHPQTYLEAKDKIFAKKLLTGDDLVLEFMLNALRLTDGVASRLFSERTGLPLARLATRLATARRRGLLTDDPQRLQPTELGQRFLNDLLELFLPGVASRQTCLDENAC